MGANVIIRKQHIKVHASDEQQALKLRQVINDSLQSDLVIMMEKVFEKYATQNRYVNIDRIDLDLGAINAPDFDRQFIQRVEARLSHELSKKLYGSDNELTWQNRSLAGFAETAGIPHSSFQFSSQKQQDMAALLHFVESGNFPWWYKQASFKSPNELLQSFTGSDWETLLRLIALKRTRNDFVLKKILHRMFQYLPESAYTMVIDQLVGLQEDDSSKRSLREVLGKKEELQQLLKINEREFLQVFFTLVLTGEELKEAGIINWFMKEFKRGIVAEHPAHGDSDQESLTGTNETNLEKEGIYIENAGLVLLHPFLRQLFETIGLVNDAGHFQHPANANKAAVLLYYLQSGNDEYNEWEMAFNKILCGLAWDDVMPGELTLSAQDKAEANQLLQVVVNYWEALKGASVDSVRNTFLLRPGKLTRKDDHWLLQVERSGVDILLEKLPWGFGTIKFPWLSHLIHTEW